MRLVWRCLSYASVRHGFWLCVRAAMSNSASRRFVAAAVLWTRGGKNILRHTVACFNVFFGLMLLLDSSTSEFGVRVPISRLCIEAPRPLTHPVHRAAVGEQLAACVTVVLLPRLRWLTRLGTSVTYECLML